jgi:CheY-like chemotaxis protein/PAS domain-containing protein
MSSLRSQVLLILAVAFGSLLVAKTLVDFSRLGPRIEDDARAQARVALLQSGPLVERAYSDGHLNEVRRFLGQLAGSPGIRRVALIGEDGGVLASSEAALEGRPAAETALAPMLPLAGAQGGMAIAGRALHAAAPVKLESATPDSLLPGPPVPAGGRGSLVLELDLGERMAAARLAALVENGIGFAVALVVLTLIGLLLELRLGRPARQIVSAIEQFDMGDRTSRTGIRGFSEIAGIGKAFDFLAERVQGEENHLLDTQASLDGLLKALPVGVMVVKRDDGKPYYVNPRWRELFGITMDANRDILAILSTVRCERPDGSPYPIEQLPISTVLRSGEPAEARDLCVRRDDRVVALIAHAVPVALSRGTGFDGVLVIAREAEAADHVAPGPAAPAGRRLRAAEPAPLPITAPAPASTSGGAENDARETVLLAEGDVETRLLASQALTEGGYRVLVAEDGASALSLLRSHGPRVALVILDLALEGPGGGSVLDALLALDPAARVIAASHYRPDLPELAASGKVTAFVTRPYSTDRLMRAVREVVVSVAGSTERVFAP